MRWRGCAGRGGQGVRACGAGAEACGGRGRVMVCYFVLGTVPRGEGPAIEIAPGWPLAAKSAYADWLVSGVPLKK